MSVGGGYSRDFLKRYLSEPSLASLRCGNELIERYRALKNATKILEDHFLRVETRWLKIKIQVDFLRRIWKYGLWRKLRAESTASQISSVDEITVLLTSNCVYMRTRSCNGSKANSLMHSQKSNGRLKSNSKAVHFQEPKR